MRKAGCLLSIFFFRSPKKIGRILTSENRSCSACWVDIGKLGFIGVGLVQRERKERCVVFMQFSAGSHGLMKSIRGAEFSAGSEGKVVDSNHVLDRTLVTFAMLK